jgi:hypothetical protein
VSSFKQNCMRTKLKAVINHGSASAQYSILPRKPSGAIFMASLFANPYHRGSARAFMWKSGKSTQLNTIKTKGKAPPCTSTGKRVRSCYAYILAQGPSSNCKNTDFAYGHRSFTLGCFRASFVICVTEKCSS